MRAKMPVAVHLFLCRGEEVLLLLRANTGYEDGKFGVVAGHVEAGETVTEAAIREAREEAGITVARGDLALAGIMHRKSQDERIDFFFEVHRWLGTPANCEPDKCAGLAWYRRDGLPANMVTYIRDALALPRDGRWFEEHGWPAAS